MWSISFPSPSQLMKLQSFLHPKDDFNHELRREQPELRMLSAYHSCGSSWATSAMKEATSIAMENPSHVVIQALEVLQLYWFGSGRPNQGTLCLGKLSFGAFCLAFLCLSRMLFHHPSSQFPSSQFPSIASWLFTSSGLSIMSFDWILQDVYRWSWRGR